MKIDLQELKRLAGEATPGPWESHDGRGIWCPNAKVGGITKIFDVRGWGYFTGLGHGALGMSEADAIKQQEANGMFVAAAYPEVIKALVDVVEAAEAYRTAKTADECDVTAERLEAALSVFTESTNEEA